jgi:hypothetical protein
VRILSKKDVDGASGDVYLYELAGLSTETKPTKDVATGSSFLEVNTTNVYFYEETTETWYPAGGSTGGDSV